MAIRIGWTRQQLLVAFNLYCRMPFGKMHSRNPEIVKYAELMGRTPSALAMKLTNIASLDPAITSTGRRGLEGASAADKAMWHLTVNDHLVCESSNGAVAVYCVLGHVYVARAYKQDNFYVFDKPNYTEDQWKKFRTNNKRGNRFADPCKLELLRYTNQFSTMKEATIFAEANLPKDQKNNVYIYDKYQYKD